MFVRSMRREVQLQETKEENGREGWKENRKKYRQMSRETAADQRHIKGAWDVCGMVAARQEGARHVETRRDALKGAVARA